MTPAERIFRVWCYGCMAVIGGWVLLSIAPPGLAACLFEGAC